MYIIREIYLYGISQLGTFDDAGGYAPILIPIEETKSSK